jgi:uncharacterized protein
MSFTWNAFSPLLIFLDGLIVLTFGGFFFLLRWRSHWISLLGATGVTLALWGLIGLSSLGIFFIARLIWTTFTVALPLGMIFLWLRTRQILWGAGVLMLLSLKLYGETVEPRRLEVTSITLHSEKIHNPLRIAHISDIQTDGLNSMYREARDVSNAFDPHLVLFTGDLVNHPSLLPDVEHYLAGFKRREGAYLVGGNIDSGMDLNAIARHAGFENIEGRSERLSYNGNSIVVMGLGIRNALQVSFLQAIDQKTGSGDLVLLLSHYPDTLIMAQNEAIDLLFSGHTHGGQLCLPWFGPIITFSSVPSSIAAGGLHKIGNLQIIVNRGLGWEGHVAPRVRLFCRPQVILLEIVPTRPIANNSQIIPGQGASPLEIPSRSATDEIRSISAALED